MENFENTDKTINMLRNAFSLTGDIEVFMQTVALEKEKENIKNQEATLKKEEVVSQEDVDDVQDGISL